MKLYVLSALYGLRRDCYPHIVPTLITDCITLNLACCKFFKTRKKLSLFIIIVIIRADKQTGIKKHLELFNSILMTRW